MKAFSDRQAGEMTLARIIRYAGVIGDFNPIHHDDAFAKNAGLPSVIAHGPLTFTMALDVLLAEGGKDSLSGFSCRFKAPVSRQPGLGLLLRGWAGGGQGGRK